MSSKGKQKQPSPGDEANATELSTYFAKVSAAMARIDEEMARWNNYKADYKALKETLQDLPKQTTHNIMVPLGSLAFMPGQLIHTNEVLVMLGDNWFVDRSAHQASEIVDRRVALVQENLDKLIEQQKELREKSGIAPGLLGGQEYNEEGLPIVDIVEPYQSDEEMEVEQESKKVFNPESMPTPNKSKEQLAKDAALLKRLEELEREDEERERRRAAGEEVTSDEDEDEEEEGQGEEDEDEYEYDSEDDFRPRNLDSDEEYPEAMYDDSEDEEQDMEVDDDDETAAAAAAATASKSSGNKKKKVRFTDDTKKAAAPSRSTGAKPRSPADLIQRMRNQALGLRGSGSSGGAGSSHVVTLDNLESTFAGMNVDGEDGDEADGLTGLPKELDWSALERMALRDKENSGNASASASKGKQVVSPATTTATATAGAEAAPPQKKQSLFRQSRQVAVGDVQETQPASAPPTAKMSRFAQQRAQAAEAAAKATTTAAATATATATATPAAARGGVSEKVVERGGVVAETEAKPVERSAVTGFRDVIENTFTRPTPPAASPSGTSSSHPRLEAGEADEEEPSTKKKRKSLFRQLAQQQQSSSMMMMEPEPATPSDAYMEVDEEPKIEGTATIPQVMNAASPSKSPLPRVGGVKIPEVGAASSSSSSSSRPVRVIKPVENTQLRDTSIMKGGVVEKDKVDPVDEDEVEEDMLMRQVVSEYQERRQAMIAKYGAFNREDIERIWEQQVVLPPEVKESLQEAEAQQNLLKDTREEGVGSSSLGADGERGEKEEATDDQQQESKASSSIGSRNRPPKKVSLFRAARLTGALAKE
ncbi:uri1, prefoldin-like chaperone [Actinomortierella ambigua]|uniref:Uri1, prefoldin-like chaperone n=1 Tax=Actinomortierella ambigua TaxID=1343610 RepID=A0A9P6Q297_9FUNG|nr:uri1, prefoldin-like chaperone [Actinomortierella ambigua]